MFRVSGQDPVDLNVATTQFWFYFGWEMGSGHVYQASGNFEYYYFWPTGWYPPNTGWERFDDDWFTTGIRTNASYWNLLFCDPLEYTFADHTLSAEGRHILCGSIGITTSMVTVPAG